ncbi:hypothetical protein ACIQZG_09730 [Lysinibacillus sp. NPDC096418]|uniref:hypothetical protein n=1 Tax=Lysinibacillus sp. NPDC096418 TaxID=3364138 RepID=UPI0037F596A8
MIKKLLSSAFVLAIMLPSPALAKEDSNLDNFNLPVGNVDITELPLEYQETLAKRTKEVDKYFEEIGKLRAEINFKESEIKNQREQGYVTANMFSNLDALNDQLEYFENNSLEMAGLEKIGTQEPQIQPFSNNNQADVSPPTIYYDADTNSYVLSSGWKWNTINPDNNNSYYDAFGIRVNQEPVSVFSYGISTYDYYGNSYKPAFTEPESSTYGYMLTFEDKAIGRNYTAHSGTSFMFFKYYNGIPNGKTVNFNSEYVHTYEKTTLNNPGVGINSFFGTFSSKESGWRAKNSSFKTYQ